MPAAAVTGLHVDSPCGSLHRYNQGDTPQSINVAVPVAVMLLHALAIGV
jgi:hypothetical protein